MSQISPKSAHQHILAVHLTCPRIRRYYISYISNISYTKTFYFSLLKNRTVIFGIGHILNSSFNFWRFPDCYQSADFFQPQKVNRVFFLLGMQGIIKEPLGCLKILTPNTHNQFSPGPRAVMSLTAFAWPPSLQSPARTVIIDTSSGLHMLGTATHGQKSNRGCQKPALPSEQQLTSCTAVMVKPNLRYLHDTQL